MTCRDVVESGRYPYTGRLGILSEADREAVDEAMALTSTTELSGVDFAQISDGQRQRVMLARAMSQQPELLILDEPTSYLDIRHKLELLNTLKKLVREKNTAVLMSLHELDLALRVSDKIVCIDGGKVGARWDSGGDILQRIHQRAVRHQRSLLLREQRLRGA